MTEKRCATCKHWGEFRKDGQRPKRFNPEQEQYCNMLSFQSYGSSCGFYTTYDNDQSAEVVTAPTFGCALWEGIRSNEAT